MKRKTCSSTARANIPGYNYYNVAGMAIDGKDKGEAEQRRTAGERKKPVTLKHSAMGPAFYIAGGGSNIIHRDGDHAL